MIYDVVMQTVSSAFTAEEKDSVRKIAHSLMVSWKKETNLSNRTFTIGVSGIGGNDVVGLNPGAVGGASIYNYFNESDYVLSIGWERGLNFPVGGLSKALAEARLSNTSGRFTPRYMGGNSELFTAILPRRPVLINAGFNYSGVDQMIPQFAGVITEQPRVNMRDRSVALKMADYIDFFQNRYLDQTTMFTGLRTDQVLESLFSQLGMATSQYELDFGINIIPFGMFPKGKRFADIMNDLVAAEGGYMYQNEEGKFIFQNRQRWDSSPYNAVQRIVLTGQVINAEAPNDDHIINVVEVRSEQRNKQPEQTIFKLSTLDAILIPANSTKEIFIEFENPALSVTTPTSSGTVSFFVANSAEDGAGSDLSGNISVTKLYNFANNAKIEFTNSGASNAYITALNVSGRAAVKERDIYVRVRDPSSVTAFEERPLQVENPFIQDETWANSLAQMIVNDFSSPENIQRISIRAMPSLQLGDLISWQGRYWRIFHMATMLSPQDGFIQELTLVQRTITSYFRIGISTIGGDSIAP